LRIHPQETCEALRSPAFSTRNHNAETNYLI
jgi:hypothetical protein